MSRFRNALFVVAALVLVLGTGTTAPAQQPGNVIRVINRTQHDVQYDVSLNGEPWTPQRLPPFTYLDYPTGPNVIQVQFFRGGNNVKYMRVPMLGQFLSQWNFRDIFGGAAVDLFPY